VIQVDPLHELVPDLRADVRAFDATIGGEPLARRDEGESEIEGLAEAGFGLRGVLGSATDRKLRVPFRRSPGGEAA
jgi:hypothetical protein